MIDFRLFRIAEAYRPSSIINLRDGLLHLVYRAGDLQTVCHRDVSNLTQLRLRDFGRPADDVTWCATCKRRLRIMEDKEMAERRGYVPTDSATIQELLRLTGEGMSQREACELCGISQSTASKILKRELALSKLT